MRVPSVEDVLVLSEKTRVIMGVFDLLTNQLATCLGRISDDINSHDDWHAEIAYFDGAPESQ